MSGEWRYPGNTAEQNPTNKPREAKLNKMHTRRETIKVKQEAQHLDRDPDLGCTNLAGLTD